jgi:hypothetical protein
MVFLYLHMLLPSWKKKLENRNDTAQRIQRFISQHASEAGKTLETVGCLSILSEDMYTVNSHEKICETKFFVTMVHAKAEYK